MFKKFAALAAAAALSLGVMTGRGIWNFLKRKKSALHGKKVQGALWFQLALFRR